MFNGLSNVVGLNIRKCAVFVRMCIGNAKICLQSAWVELVAIVSRIDG